MRFISQIDREDGAPPRNKRRLTAFPSRAAGPAVAH